MRRVLFAMLLVAAPHGVSDVTWDFAEGLGGPGEFRNGYHGEQRNRDIECSSGRR